MDELHGAGIERRHLGRGSRGGLATALAGRGFVVGGGEFLQFLLDEVLHGLHVVVGHGLDVLNALRVGQREILVHGPQTREQRVGELRQLRQRQLTQGDEILYLYAHTIAYERIFREVGIKGLRLGAVAPVDGRYGC